jgi:HEPN domain-containing protein
MLRKDFQDLAEERIQDAEALLAAGRYSAARYLAGLAVECALKARIAGQTREHEFPDKEWATKVFTHNLETLLKLAGLEHALTLQTRGSDAFQENWNKIRGWRVEWRYDSPVGEAEATTFVQSVADATEGILPWLRARW